ncbi:MAG: nitrogenase component 1 [Deltaproteobacteria bacterium]|nr:nitrogenase component 1 [Deltaproteobacteria bacterium]
MHRFEDVRRDDIEGLRIGCGEFSINEFSKILNLANTEFVISKMGWIGNQIVLDIVSKIDKDYKITLYITRRIDTRPSLIKTGHLDIFYSGCEAGGRLTSHLLSLDFSGITFEELVGIIRSDPEFGSPALSLPSFEVHDKPENHLDSWGGKDLYANFWAEGEFARGQLDSVNIYENCIFVQHSDIECVSLKPNLDLRLVRFLVKYPWLSKNRNKYRRLKRNELPDITKFFSTDLNEKDIVMGNNKVKEVLEYVLSNSKRKEVFLSNTCTPVVIGEDVESVIERMRKKRKNLLYLTVTPQSMEVVLKRLFWKYRKKGNSIKKNVVNLLGYEKDWYLERLIYLCKTLGIEINSVVIPDVSPRTLRKYFNGGVDIIKPNALWNHLYLQLNNSSSHKYVALEAPYGFAGTIRWLLNLSVLVGFKLKEDDILKKIENKRLNLYNSLKDQMSNIGVVFIIRKGEDVYLTDSARSWGVPLLKFFMEVGSRIEVFIRADNREEAQRSSEKILKSIKDYDNYEVRFFDTYDKMMRLLTESSCRLVFSNHSNDWRIWSAGKNSFSLFDFEVGFEGAIYTINRLLYVANIEVFPKYSSYLKRDFVGRYEDQ